MITTRKAEKSRDRRRDLEEAVPVHTKYDRRAGSSTSDARMARSGHSSPHSSSLLQLPSPLLFMPLLLSERLFIFLLRKPRTRQKRKEKNKKRKRQGNQHNEQWISIERIHTFSSPPSQPPKPQPPYHSNPLLHLHRHHKRSSPLVL
jgi:hypothetical protein